MTIKIEYDIVYIKENKKKIIEVRECDEVVFNGDADEFLFMQDNDIELENLLDKLESKPYNSIVRFEDMSIEQLLDLLWD